jgi:hypothetical protein
MVTQRSSRISLAILIICLCLGSLVAMPVINAFGPSALEISDVSAENNDSSNLTEFDEDFLLEAIMGVTNAHLIFSNCRQANLGFQIACPAPVFPPPKSA